MRKKSVKGKDLTLELMRGGLSLEISMLSRSKTSNCVESFCVNLKKSSKLHAGQLYF